MVTPVIFLLINFGVSLCYLCDVDSNCELKSDGELCKDSKTCKTYKTSESSPGFNDSNGLEYDIYFKKGRNKYLKESSKIV